MKQEGISYWKRLPAESKGTDEFHAVIEIPRGEKVKYEYSKMFDVLFLDRVLYSSVHYPENYGFIPQTMAKDDDPIDILLICQEPLVPLTVAQTKPIGGIDMEDEKGVDHKIIGVASQDPQYSEYEDIKDLPDHKMREIRQFFSEYKKLEEKEVEVRGYFGPDKALGTIDESMERFNQTYPEIEPITEDAKL
ncbi:MAG: inorganic diphosphatase [bacterium]